jgi:hypothetical protein
MTPHEKAVAAINARLQQLQSELRVATAESAQRFLFQAIVVAVAAAEALNDFIATVGRHGERRHGEAKQANEALAAQHAALLNSGRELLEKLKANPGDRSLRKEIELAQNNMATIQKVLRRATNALQRDLAPGLAMVDRMAEDVRRFADAGDAEALRRFFRAIVGHVGEFCAAHTGPAKGLVDVALWGKTGLAELDQAAGFNDAYARAGYQGVMALESATMVLADEPPRTAEDATARASDMAAARLKRIAARFTADGAGGVT